MYSWYTGKDIDFIGKQEKLTSDLISVLEKIGIKFDKNIILNEESTKVSKKRGLKADREVVREFHRVEYPTLVRYDYEVPDYIK
ncbi:ABC-type uncharacterized transport system involved in gliding motility auxiliary subunit [Salinibacter ruber]|uniref:hypothetical protein n=1 Tax=Salinibacter ruber TaxID=146919 RepID=UPI002168B1CA|nr:hypothetical protein [Salinibacter ruber]MCS4086117.1 ABC-type uncharacterized transport system involved in gliding motility auxiliary subunit [Salinibacter ruber]